MNKNRLGGFDYTDKEDLRKAKDADLVTLPKGLQEGINCSNCIWVKSIDSKEGLGVCKHPKVNLVVNKVMCCKYMDNTGMIRSWKK